jgi:hypothetical protein
MIHTFRNFELEAIQILSEGVLTPEQISLLREHAGQSDYEYTGSGYFISIVHPLLPEQEQTLSSPAVVGQAGAVQAGFVLFISNHKLTLECHTWGEIDVPDHFREESVTISAPPVTRMGGPW